MLARPGFAEEDEEVLCDPAFLVATRLAVGPVSNLRAHAAHIVDETHSAERPQRQRKTRVIQDV